MVRIEPKNPIPSIDFRQWDGLLRICFQRKNKLIAAIFKTKVVLKLLFANFKRAKKHKQQQIASGINLEFFAREESEGMILTKKKRKKKTRRDKNKEIVVEGIIEESMNQLEVQDEDDQAGFKFQEENCEPELGEEETKVELEMFKAKLIKILGDNGFAEERAQKMHWSRFLELLQILNENEVYFN